MSRPWLLYGATGYTGELIAREAVRRGMRPVLAGRSQDKLAKLASELGCPSAMYSLDDHTSLVASLQDVATVLHCAGPFSRTARTVMQACLASHVHYLDITGEIEVFELAHSVDEKAQRAGVVLCPGVGFDVVPTDCLALKLKLAMPDATHLTLGFESHSGVSKGTAKTAVEAVANGGRVREEGRIVEIPLGSRTRRIDFGNGERLATAIPWGDVSTAYYSTGIGNVEVYTALSERALRRMRRANRLRPLLRRRWMTRLLQYGIERSLTPPSQTQRENNPTFLWGEARNAAGQVIAARQRTSSGYALTVSASLGILSMLPSIEKVSGYVTPSMVVGPDFISTLPGCSQIRMESSACAG